MVAEVALDTSGQSMWPFCPDIALDPLGHHIVNCLQDEVFYLYHRAHSVERGHGSTRDLAHTKTKDIFVETVPYNYIATIHDYLKSNTNHILSLWAG